MRLMLTLIPFFVLLAQTPAPPAIENDSVRVLSVTDQPVSQPGPLHDHAQNRVMVYLDSGDMQIKYADGKVENQHWTPGDVAWSPAGGMHTSQNVSKRPIRIIEIELKTTGNAATNGPPDRTRAIIDNAQVRVYKASRAPAASKNYVAVDIRSATVMWNQVPKGPGPFVITEVK